MSVLDLVKTRRFSRASRQRNGWIGIDIGRSAIKIAQVERAAGETRLARSLILRSEPETVFDAQSLVDGRIGREIHEALTAHGGFEGRHAACTVSMDNCELRTVAVAKGTEDEQRDMIALELSCEAPPGSEQREFSFWDASTQDREERNGMNQVYVISLAQSFSDSLAANMQHAGLECRILDAVPFALLRAVDLARPCSLPQAAPATPVAILDWGYSAATLVVIRNGQPALTRLLRNCGLKNILETIDRRLKLETAESDALMTTYGVRNDIEHSSERNELQTIITEIVNKGMRNLAAELNETLSFLRMQFAELMPGHVWLTGGGGMLPGIAQGLQSEINVAAEVWNLPGRSTDEQLPGCLFANAAALSALAWEL